MSRVLDEMPVWAKGPRVGRREAYPYDNWFDGQVHELNSPDDYVQNIRTMAANIKRAAERRRIKVSVAHNGTVIIVKATVGLARESRREIDLDILAPEVAVTTPWSNKPDAPVDILA